MKLGSVTLSTVGCLIKIKVAEVGKFLLTKTFQLSWIVSAAPVKSQGQYFQVHLCTLGGGDFWQSVSGKQKEQCINCFSCSRKRVTEGTVSHCAQYVGCFLSWTLSQRKPSSSTAFFLGPAVTCLKSFLFSLLV